MKRFQQYAAWALGLYFVLYLILHFYNLDRIPLVWFDEVMGLDPAVNAVFKDGFHSKIWPQQGTEDRFMAYLPMRFLFHMLHLAVLPFEVYWQRLPWALYFLGSAVFLYLTVRHYGLSSLWGLILVFVFINDKAVFEVGRSMRVDPLSLVFLAALAWAWIKEQRLLQAVLASLLVFIHPNLWAIALPLFLHACSKGVLISLKPHKFWLIPISAALLYSISISFDYSGFLAQLFEHGSYHDASGGIAKRVKDHFVTRFWPYYSTQFWMPLIIYSSLIWSIWTVFKKQAGIWQWALILTHLYWLIALAPFYRYNAVLLLLSLIALLPILGKIAWPKWSLVPAVILLILSPINVLARHSLAIAQRAERDPKPVISWLKQEVANNSCLVIGHDVAYYALAQNRSQDYMMFNLPADKFNYGDYKHHYALLADFPDSNFLFYDSLPKIYFSNRNGPKAKWKLVLSAKADVPSYDGLMLFEIKDQEAFIQLHTYLDANN